MNTKIAGGNLISPCIKNLQHNILVFQVLTCFCCIIVKLSFLQGNISKTPCPYEATVSVNLVTETFLSV